MFQGIGACDKVVVATFIPEKQDFMQHECNGMLEMISLQGNVVTERGGKWSYRPRQKTPFS
jgi:predicted DNA-binding protein with PD1-like motif